MTGTTLPLTRSTGTTNGDQISAWDGEEGDEWTEHADRYDAACRRYDQYLIGGAQLVRTDQVLDVGCGTGISARDAARVVGQGHVTGIDLSARMLAEADRRSAAAGLTNITFVQGDAQVYRYRASTLDVVISRFGAMFFADPVAAFANLARGLRPQGRLALLSWQEGHRNEWVQAVRESLAAGRTLPEPPAGKPGPFGLAEPGVVRRILASAGFSDADLTAVREPVYLGADPDDASTFVCGMGLSRGLLNGLDESARKKALEVLRDRLATYAGPEGVLVGGSGWLITARRQGS